MDETIELLAKLMEFSFYPQICKASSAVQWDRTSFSEFPGSSKPPVPFEPSGSLRPYRPPEYTNTSFS